MTHITPAPGKYESCNRTNDLKLNRHSQSPIFPCSPSFRRSGAFLSLPLPTAVAAVPLILPLWLFAFAKLDPPSRIVYNDQGAGTFVNYTNSEFPMHNLNF